MFKLFQKIAVFVEQVLLIFIVKNVVAMSTAVWLRWSCSSRRSDRYGQFGVFPTGTGNIVFFPWRSSK
jgi:NADH:ubiquinone oxidoreductase subunit H